MTAIPSVPKNADAETRRFLEAVKQILEIGTTDRAGAGESFVRTKDLVSGGIAKVNRAGTIAGVAVASQSVTPQVPNGITGLSATGVFTQIILDWIYGGPNDVEYFEVYRALGTQTIADAVVVGTTQAQVFADAGVTPGVEYLYWVRGVNDTKFGAYSDIDGVSATLDADILTALAALSGGVTENNLSQELIERMTVLSGNTQEVLDRSSAIAAEIIERKNADDNNASQISTVAIDVTTVNSSLSDEVTARQTAVSDLANTVAGQQTEITTTAEDLVAETTARVAQISSLDSQMAGVIETTTTLTSDLSAETTARTIALSSVEGSVASLQTDVSTNATDISAETAARDSAISSINSTIASIESDVTTNVTDLNAETNARETAISTVNSAIASIQSDISTNATDLSAETSTRESQYTQTLESLASIQTDLTTATDDISAEVSAREAQYATINTAVAAVITDVTTVASDLSAETTARTDQIASLNTSIATLTTDISTVASDLGTEVTALETAIANVGTDTAAVESIVNAKVDPLEDAVEASFVLRTNANNQVAGFSLFNSADEPTTFDIIADKFSISPTFKDYGQVKLQGFDIEDWMDGATVTIENFFAPGLPLLFDSNRNVDGQNSACMFFHYDDARDAGLTIPNLTMKFELGGSYYGPPLYTITGPPRYLFTSFGHQYWGIRRSQSSAVNQRFIQGSVTEAGSTVSPFSVNAVNGQVSMNTALIGTAAINDAQIASLAASKITADNLAAISANLGAITAGTMTGPDNRFRIDLANNRLDVYDENETLRVRLGFLG